MTFPRWMHPARVSGNGTSRTPAPTAGCEYRERRESAGGASPSPTGGGRTWCETNTGRRGRRPLRRGCEYRARRESAGGASPSPTGWCETNAGRRGRRPLRRYMTFPRLMHPARVPDNGPPRASAPTAGTEVSAKTVARLRNQHGTSRTASPTGAMPRGRRESAGRASPSPTAGTGCRGRRPLRALTEHSRVTAQKTHRVLNTGGFPAM